MNSEGVSQESDVSRATGAVEKNNLPILVSNDNSSKTMGACHVLAKGVDPFALKLHAAPENGTHPRRVPCG